MSFSARLSWQTSVILAATMLVVFAYTWIRAQGMMEDLSDRAVRQASSQIDDQIGGLFTKAEQTSRFLAELASPSTSFIEQPLGRRRFESIAEEMYSLTAATPELTTLCVVVDRTGESVRAVRFSNGQVQVEMALRDGNGELQRRTVTRLAGRLILGPVTGLAEDLRGQEFYRRAKERQELAWTGTRTIAIPDEAESPGVTCAAPINPSGIEVVGVAYVDLSLTGLSRYVQQIRVSEHGYAFLGESRTDGPPRVIAHPDPNRLLVAEGERLRLATPDELGDPAVSELFAHMGSLQGVRSGTVQRLRFVLNGRQMLGGYGRLGGGGRPEWIVGIVVPMEEFMGDLASDRNVLVMFAVIALMAGVYVSLLLAQRIATPVRAIVAETQRIRSLDFGPRPQPATTISELQMLGTAVEDLKTSLRSFEKLVPTQYARHLVTTGQEAKLGGERRHITIYFADIVGFTRLSEMMPPEELVEVLAEYLDVLSGKVIEHNGTVDKFNGDDVMAFWGAPHAVENPAREACVAAVRSRQAIQTMHKEWAESGRPVMGTAFGIATGDVVVGNVGSRARMNYTVIGDAVNLASRLQGLNKFYETSVLIGGQTMVEAGDAVLTRLVDYVAVAGREHAAAVYELMALTSEATADEVRVAALHNKAMADYRARRFVEAADGFRTVIAVREKDGPARILLKRCLEYADSPPGPDWDGSYRAETK